MPHALVLDPKKEIHFPGPYNESYTTKLLVHNRGEQNLAFKLMTLDPRHYLVRPSRGIIGPRQVITIAIKLYPIKNVATFKAARQKFMVQSVPAPEGSTVNNVNALFEKALVGDIAFSKVRAIFDNLGMPEESFHSSCSTESETSTAKRSDSFKTIASIKSADSNDKIESMPTTDGEGSQATNVQLEAAAPSPEDHPQDGQPMEEENTDGGVASAPDIASVKVTAPCSVQSPQCPVTQAFCSSAKYLAIASGLVLLAFVLYRCTRSSR